MQKQGDAMIVKDDEKIWLKEDNIKKLYHIDDDPERKAFLDGFFSYRKTKGLYNKMPVIARKPLDLYHLYSTVQKYGGFEQSMKNRMWSQIARELDLPRSMTSGAFTLKLKYIKLLYEYECFKRKKRVDPLIIQSANRLDDYSQEQRHEKENKQHASSQRKYPREQEVVILDDGDGLARPKYHEGNMHRSHFRDDLIYTKRKGNRESFPDYQPPMERRCSIYYDENDVFSDNLYQEASRQKNPGDNLNNIQINFMLISPEKLEVSLTLDNQRFSGKLFSVS